MHLTRKRIKCTIYGVLSVSKLTPGQEGYYERSVAAGIDDYYAGRGESPGIWTGRGAARSVDGVVEDGQLHTLIRGDHPLTGENLRRQHPKARTITVEKIDRQAASGDGRKTSARSPASTSCSPSRRASASCTRSATSRPPGGQRGAHRRLAGRRLPRGRSVRRPPRHRRRRPRARRGLCRRRLPAPHLAAQEPQLHTHVIVANMAAAPATASGGRSTARRFSRRTGSPPATSTRPTCAASSPRVSGSSGRRRTGACRPQGRGARGDRRVLDPADAGGRAHGRARHERLLGRTGRRFDTRDRKEHVDLVRLREEWRARAAEHGLGRSELDAVMHRVLAGRARASCSRSHAPARPHGLAGARPRSPIPIS